MSDNRPDFYTRRLFLQHGVTFASIAATAPLFLQRTGYALADFQGEVSSRAGVPDERILVVLQLGGGNDGLNTVIPFEDPAYHRARPSIGLREGGVIRLGKRAEVGLHPALTGFQSLHDDGLLSIVQGVGYPNPNRSHFASMDIWHSASDSGVRNGWLGRYFDNECAGKPGGGACAPISGVAIDTETPLAMQGRRFRPVSFETVDSLRWVGDEIREELGAARDGIVKTAPEADTDDDAAFLMRTALDARYSSEQIRLALDADAHTEYPRNPLAQRLRTIAAMIQGEMSTRVYYASQGGYDTHAGQGGEQGRHANLLGQLGNSVRAFYDDLRATGDEQRVLMMIFSEFGRRVSQNASNGTDHGAAAPMFLVGPMVRAGVVGRHPSLTDLDDGDLRFKIDFRSVYSAVLQKWMQTNPRNALGRSWSPARVLR